MRQRVEDVALRSLRPRTYQSLLLEAIREEVTHLEVIKRHRMRGERTELTRWYHVVREEHVPLELSNHLPCQPSST